jgi:hypothetical protein
MTLRLPHIIIRDFTSDLFYLDCDITFQLSIKQIWVKLAQVPWTSREMSRHCIGALWAVSETRLPEEALTVSAKYTTFT